MSCSVKETSLQVCSCSSCAKLIETEGIPFILEKQQARFKENERDVLNRKEKAVTLEKTVERREVPQKGNTMSEILMAQILANEKLVEKVSELQDLLVLAAAREDELQEKMRQLQEEVESARHELREKTAELEEKMEQDKKKEEEKVPPEISRMLENLASRYAEVMGSPMPV